MEDLGEVQGALEGLIYRCGRSLKPASSSQQYTLSEAAFADVLRYIAETLRSTICFTNLTVACIKV